MLSFTYGIASPSTKLFSSKQTFGSTLPLATPISPVATPLLAATPAPAPPLSCTSFAIAPVELSTLIVRWRVLHLTREEIASGPRSRNLEIAFSTASNATSYKQMGKRVSRCLKNKWAWVKERLSLYVRLPMANTWLELRFCPLIYVPSVLVLQLVRESALHRSVAHLRWFGVRDRTCS